MLTIGQLANKTNVKVTTIRYFEKIGLMFEPVRTSGNHRHYSNHHLQRLNFIKSCRNLGFSQNDIRELLGLNDNISLDCAEVNIINQRHLQTIRQKIAHLKSIKLVLEKLEIACEKNQGPQCPIIEVLNKEVNNPSL